MTLRPLIARTLAGLPTGQTLPENSWRRRHAGLQIVLAAHVPALVVFALLRGFGLETALLAMLPTVVLLAMSGAPGRSRTARAVALMLGLLCCSALLVLFWGGTTEAHFHYFVVVGVAALYEGWVPYAIAIAFVVLQHGLGSALFPHSVYDHGAAHLQAWGWAFVHGAFVAALAIANIVSWKANERLREQRADAEASLYHQANHDLLTGLPNRGRFVEQLNAVLERGDVAVIFADLDDFKVVNDSLGHQAGDEFLVEAAKRLAAALRPGDLLGRFGGDEFVIAVPGVTDTAKAERLAGRLAAALAEPYALRGNARLITASFGIALVDDDERVAEALLRDADVAMYRAKDLGKDRAIAFDGTMRTQAVSRLELEAGLRRALDEQQLEVHYQPQIAFDDERIVGLEALVRWRHPQLGMISPGRFIPVAEQSGLIDALGEWVLREACAQIAVWNAERDPAAEPLVVSVNVSARQVGNPRLPAVVAETLAAAGVAPAQLCLELTESAIIADPETGLRVMAELKALGVRVAIDDFGVGHSSLSQLVRFATADELKIDKSFVDRIETPEHRAIAAAIVSLAGALGFAVVAEGVETAVQATILRELGCEVAQGFHYARPEPADAIRPRLLGPAVAAATVAPAV